MQLGSDARDELYTYQYIDQRRMVAHVGRLPRLHGPERSGHVAGTQRAVSTTSMQTRIAADGGSPSWCAAAPKSRRHYPNHPRARVDRMLAHGRPRAGGLTLRAVRAARR